MPAVLRWFQATISTIPPPAEAADHSLDDPSPDRWPSSATTAPGLRRRWGDDHPQASRRSGWWLKRCSAGPTHGESWLSGTTIRGGPLAAARSDRTTASPSPSIRCSSSKLARLRLPFGLPAGLPDWPGAHRAERSGATEGVGPASLAVLAGLVLILVLARECRKGFPYSQNGVKSRKIPVPLGALPSS
jgi:hypothetical protein